MMRKLYYVGLESYQARYTYQLQDWNERVFKKRNIDYEIVYGDNLSTDQQIVTGQVLDAHGRSYYSLTQMANLVKLMNEGKITHEDVILFEDMFTPGIESIPYILNQVRSAYRPLIFVRCLAQTIDPDDFVHTTGMTNWMSKYEQMVNHFVTAVLATNEEMVAHMKIAGWKVPIYNISGLAFNKEEVQSRIDSIKPFNERSYRIGYASRLDVEKNPNFFLDIIDSVLSSTSIYKFSIFSGGPLKSNSTQVYNRIREYKKEGKLTVHENLSKNEYYNLLNDTRVLLNTACQDWTSNTVNEADALGANVLYPAYRSFPETFANDHERLYIPWSLNDAKLKLDNLMYNPHKNIGKISDWNDKTIDRTIDIISGNGEIWNRSYKDYRTHLIHSHF
jgi:glycosyltransferase involved in cell wall biosynthesis